MSNFVMYASLGEIEVPSDYNHDTCLSTFCIRNSASCLVHPDLTDEHFGNAPGVLPVAKRKVSSWKRTSNPSRVMRAGEAYRVSLYTQGRDNVSSSQERLDFLNSLDSVFLGVQGMCLVFDQKEEMLPKTFRLLCMDDPAHLPMQSGKCLLPVLCINKTGPAVFSIGDFHALRSGNKSLFVSFVPV